MNLDVLPMKHAIESLTFAILLTSVVSCDFLHMDYVPTPKQIVASHSTFLVTPEPNSITGHYANMDVDSIVFTYNSISSGHDAFWQSIDDASSARGWKCVAQDGNQRHYERIIPKTGQKAFHSGEQVRVYYRPSDNATVVAWVQGDSIEPIDNFDSMGEAAFADRTVWPKFDSLAQKAEP